MVWISCVTEEVFEGGIPNFIPSKYDTHWRNKPKERLLAFGVNLLDRSEKSSHARQIGEVFIQS